MHNRHRITINIIIIILLLFGWPTLGYKKRVYLTSAPNDSYEQASMRNSTLEHISVDVLQDMNTS